jgi:U3 small nucleolar RNA-associated protein 20
MQYFVINLGYEYPQGRSKVAECLRLLFRKLPDHIMAEKADFFFLPLVLQLANEEASTVRAELGAAVKQLVAVLPEEQTAKLVSFCLNWIGNKTTNPALRGTAILVISLFAESLGVEFQSFLHKSAELILKRLVKMCSKKYIARSDWKHTYFCLGFLNHCLHGLTAETLELVFQKDKAFATIKECAMSEHVWLRVASGRVLTHVLKSEKYCDTAVLDDLMKITIRQLQEGEVSPEMSQIIQTNLLVCAPLVEVVEDVVEENKDSGYITRERVGLSLLLNSVQYAGRSQDMDKEETCHGIFNGILDTVDGEALALFVRDIIAGLYPRHEEKEYMNERERMLWQSAKALLSKTQKAVGSERYVTAYTSVHEKIMAFRAQRKSKRKLMAVMDPKRKQEISRKKSQKSKARKKAKVAIWKAERGKFF